MNEGTQQIFLARQLFQQPPPQREMSTMWRSLSLVSQSGSPQPPPLPRQPQSPGLKDAIKKFKRKIRDIYTTIILSSTKILKNLSFSSLIDDLYIQDLERKLQTNTHLSLLNTSRKYFHELHMFHSKCTNRVGLYRKVRQCGQSPCMVSSGVIDSSDSLNSMCYAGSGIY